MTRTRPFPPVLLARRAHTACHRHREVASSGPERAGGTPWSTRPASMARPAHGAANTDANTISGTITNTGTPTRPFVCVKVDTCDERTLVSAARRFCSTHRDPEIRRLASRAKEPRAWHFEFGKRGQLVGPHVSLSLEHSKDCSKRVKLRARNLKAWCELFTRRAAVPCLTCSCAFWHVLPTFASSCELGGPAQLLLCDRSGFEYNISSLGEPPGRLAVSDQGPQTA